MEFTPTAYTTSTDVNPNLWNVSTNVPATSTSTSTSTASASASTSAPAPETDKSFFQLIKDEYYETHHVDNFEFIIASGNLNKAVEYINTHDNIKFNIKCLTYLYNKSHSLVATTTTDANADANKVSDDLLTLYLSKISSVSDFIEAIFTTSCHNDVLMYDGSYNDTFVGKTSNWDMNIDNYLAKLTDDKWFNLLKKISSKYSLNHTESMTDSLLSSQRVLSDDKLLELLSGDVNMFFFNLIRDRFSNFNNVLDMHVSYNLPIGTKSIPLYVKFILNDYNVDNSFYYKSLNVQGLSLYHILILCDKQTILEKILKSHLYNVEHLNALDSFQNTPLMSALIKGNTFQNVVDMLLEIPEVKLTVCNNIWSTPYLLYSNILEKSTKNNVTISHESYTSDTDDTGDTGYIGKYPFAVNQSVDRPKKHLFNEPVPYNSTRLSGNSVGVLPYDSIRLFSDGLNGINIPESMSTFTYNHTIHKNSNRPSARHNYVKALEKIFTSNDFKYSVDLAKLMITSEYVNSNLFSLMCANPNLDACTLCSDSLLQTLDQVRDSMKLSLSTDPYKHYDKFCTLNEIENAIKRKTAETAEETQKPTEETQKGRWGFF